MGTVHGIRGHFDYSVTRLHDFFCRRNSVGITAALVARGFNGAMTLRSWRVVPCATMALPQQRLQWGHDLAVMERCGRCIA